MSADVSSSPVASAPPRWEPLSPVERRILGVLIEKQKTAKSADAYPLTLNALILGCNQKSNRDPVMDLTEEEVEEGLTALQKKQLVIRMTGGRAERFRHQLYEKWTSHGPAMAVLAELLLRGPQTKGDLRGRAGRMDAIDTLDQLDAILQALAARGLVVYLTDPDRRGAVVTHGFHTPEELAQLRSQSALASEPRARSGPLESGTSVEQRLAAALAELAALKDQVAALQAAVAELRRRLGDSAGAPP